jgi:hypothetical protein
MRPCDVQRELVLSAREDIVMKQLVIVASGLMVTCLTACAPEMATKEDCAKRADRMAEILNKDADPDLAKLMAPQREKWIGACEGKMSKKDAQCMIDAKDGKDYEKCP